MSDAIARFFDDLGRSGRGRLEKRTSGTIRFDLVGDHGVHHWLVTITDGEIRVSRENRDADTVVRTDDAFFRRLARGEATPMSAWLRNDITTEGEFRYIVLLRRLFPPPVGARHPRSLTPGPAEPA
ncbi:SCP2 sterol-binding domain-containing protein [Micromonospora costi]|uniref:Sterol-binding protein n=1 Tax=Micromonospora costi TaxID=1530042 RepID=A0A3A9ZWX1_9ACTN|nr:SCP2 sterol-binding domain-containing protein [Micromonospora costi]RKN52670.1 sterol-binding protein [Micromonospora costi]